MFLSTNCFIAIFRRSSERATRRAAARQFDERYTEDGGFDVGPGTLVGREALDKFAGDLRAVHPHFAYTPHGEPQTVIRDNSGCLGSHRSWFGVAQQRVAKDSITGMPSAGSRACNEKGT